MGKNLIGRSRFRAPRAKLVRPARQKCGSAFKSSPPPADQVDYSIFCELPTTTYFAPRAMNRQVGPSIALSVFIVCFFAVALFRHDPTRLSAGRTPKPSVSAADDSLRSARADHTSRPANLATSSIIDRATQTNGHIDLAPELRSGQLAAATSDAPPSFVRTASAPLSHASKQPLTANLDSRAGRSQSRTTRRPNSAFTVVERNEHIDDVAVRIYGSIDAVETLWRANRDVLPNKDFPLAEGTILRTPVLR